MIDEVAVLIGARAVRVTFFQQRNALLPTIHLRPVLARNVRPYQEGKPVIFDVQLARGIGTVLFNRTVDEAPRTGSRGFIFLRKNRTRAEG